MFFHHFLLFFSIFKMPLLLRCHAFISYTSMMFFVVVASFFVLLPLNWCFMNVISTLKVTTSINCILFSSFTTIYVPLTVILSRASNVCISLSIHWKMLSLALVFWYCSSDALSIYTHFSKNKARNCLPWILKGPSEWTNKHTIQSFSFVVLIHFFFSLLFSV